MAHRARLPAVAFRQPVAHQVSLFAPSFSRGRDHAVEHRQRARLPVDLASRGTRQEECCRSAAVPAADHGLLRRDAAQRERNAGPVVAPADAANFAQSR